MTIAIIKLREIIEKLDIVKINHIDRRRRAEMACSISDFSRASRLNFGRGATLDTHGGCPGHQSLPSNRFCLPASLSHAFG